LVAWAGAHLDEVDTARAAYDKRHGPPVRMSVAERQLAKRRVALSSRRQSLHSGARR